MLIELLYQSCISTTINGCSFRLSSRLTSRYWKRRIHSLNISWCLCSSFSTNNISCSNISCQNIGDTTFLEIFSCCILLKIYINYFLIWRSLIIPLLVNKSLIHRKQTECKRKNKHYHNPQGNFLWFLRSRVWHWRNTRSSRGSRSLHCPPSILLFCHSIVLNK